MWASMKALDDIAITRYYSRVVESLEKHAKPLDRLVEGIPPTTGGT